MNAETQETDLNDGPQTADALPFPSSRRTFCRYEPVAPSIDRARVLVVDNLLRDERDLSEVARSDWGRQTDSQLRREREIADLAIENILNNVARLVKDPATQVAHVTRLAEAEAAFRPDAIVLSGTLRDFDYYQPEILNDFGRFIRATRTPTLGICGGHQLVGLSFGARVITLDQREQQERRDNRVTEYQYRFVRIVDPADPIFQGIDNPQSIVWQDYTKDATVLRVWQNHGLQLDRVPEGFKLLATSYRCRNQMMVKRAGGRLIYSVQFHLEKSFEDWQKTHTRWEHPNESRDGRILFENFLRLALENRQRYSTPSDSEGITHPT